MCTTKCLIMKRRVIEWKRRGGSKTSSPHRTTLIMCAADRLLLSLAVSSPPKGKRQITLWDAVVAFFHSPLLDDERICARPPPGFRRQRRCWVLRRTLYCTKRANILFGRLLKDGLERAGFLTVVLVSNMFRQEPRALTVIHGDDLVGEGKATSLTT